MSIVNYYNLVSKGTNHMCHVIGENEGKPISDKSRTDIKLTTQYIADNAADPWKRLYEKKLEENYERRWNELKLWLNRYPLSKTVEDVLIAMSILDNGEDIRNHKPKYIQQLERETLNERKGSNGVMQGTIENTYRDIEEIRSKASQY
ncbi:hypothetical protein P4571_08365 [Niallia alba]|uniref:hypothetical protein n=1 Tax=Niallia alba TaxID=2729105 RepID=UPI002E235B73|nr:hypothetical protein [Niallia alba]